MEADYQTKGRILLKTRFGIVNADNFKLSPEEMAENKDWQRLVGLESEPFTLGPEELDVPF